MNRRTVAVVLAVALLSIVANYLRDSSAAIGGLVIIAVVFAGLGALWPMWVRKRDAWERTQRARAANAIVVRAAIPPADLEITSQRDRILFYLVAVPEGLELWRTWSFWRHDPGRLLMLPWSQIGSIAIGAVPAGIREVPGLLVNSSLLPTLRVRVMSEGFFANPIDASPIHRALMALRSAALPEPSSMASIRTD